MKIYIFDDKYVLAENIQEASTIFKNHYEIYPSPKIENKSNFGSNVASYLVTYGDIVHHTYYVIEKPLDKGVLW